MLKSRNCGISYRIIIYVENLSRYIDQHQLFLLHLKLLKIQDLLFSETLSVGASMLAEGHNGKYVYDTTQTKDFSYI